MKQCTRLWAPIAAALTVVMASHVFFAQPLPAQAEEKSNLLLHVSFDGMLEAEQARGQAGPAVAENVRFTEGKLGKGVLAESSVRLAYKTEGNLNAGSGSVLLWFQLHEKGKESTAVRGLFGAGNGAGAANDVFLAYYPSGPWLGATFASLHETAFHSSTSPCEAGSWHHVAMTWDCEQGIELFLDGCEVTHKTVNWSPWNLTPQFAAGSDRSFAFPLDGVVDELFIYDRQLSKEEIVEHLKWRGGELPKIDYRHPYDQGELSPTATSPAVDRDFLNRHQRLPLTPRPEISQVRHSVLHYNKRWYCGHPLMGVFKYFGGGEIIVGHRHATCDYKTPSDVSHSFLNGYNSRSVVLLQRSTDGGRTWPEEHNVVVYDQRIPTDREQAFLYQPDARRESYDMFRPESVFFFGMGFLPELRDGIPVCFALRSPDKGRTWEKVPTIITHPFHSRLQIHKLGAGGAVRMPDGKTLLSTFVIQQPGGVAVFSSTDQGLSWRFLSSPMVDLSGEGRFTYPNLLLLPNGDLHCYGLHLTQIDQTVEGVRNAICLSVSKDGGRTWSGPLPIVGEGGGCWKPSLDHKVPFPDDWHVESRAYRSPWPILLADSRILVVFTRRRLPIGLGGVVSGDGGRTWSEEFVIRDDGVSSDVGYPVGCQLDDGRIFLAYYYTMPDGNRFGGTRYLASSTFGISE